MSTFTSCGGTIEDGILQRLRPSRRPGRRDATRADDHQTHDRFIPDLSLTMCG